MKIIRKILLRIIFCIAVISCLAVKVFSDNIHSNNIELSAHTNNAGNNFCADIDSFDDDQISQPLDYEISDKNICINSIPNNCPSIFNFPFLIWQPPRI